MHFHNSTAGRSSGLGVVSIDELRYSREVGWGRFYDFGPIKQVFALWMRGFGDGEKHLYLRRYDLDVRGNRLDTREIQYTVDCVASQYV
ncbi:hypothetical protein [Sphingobacterium kitahiroshimense]|uniref:Uncharacterized protein n=1 Tax=Sphingobacterium kitahiroshimense TaxID=470446 RepID=A0ABV0BVI7_9SPHI